jgi:hypothetical protein
MIAIDEIDGHVCRFRKGEDVYSSLADYYKSVEKNWYTHLSKYFRLDKSEFHSDFIVLLFKSLLRFDEEHIGTTDNEVISKFDRYFLAAVRKLSITVRRSYRRGKASCLPLSCVQSHPDAHSDNDISLIEVMDVINGLSDPIDREILQMRFEGSPRKEICRTLDLPLHEYRQRLEKIQRHPSIVAFATSS